MTVPDAGFKIFPIAVVRGRGKLELLRPTGRVGRFREDDHVAYSGRWLRPVVETVHAELVEGLRFHVLNVHYVRHIGRRQGVGVRSLGMAGDVLDRSIGGLDGIGAEEAHD